MDTRVLVSVLLTAIFWWSHVALPLWTPVALQAQAAPEVIPQRHEIAILDFVARGGVSADEAAIITDRVRSRLFQSQRYRLMERSNMLSILKEQGFQQTQQNCESTDCSVAIGRLLAVKQLMTGSVSRLGSIYTLNYRIIDVEKGLIIADNFHDCRCTLEEVLTRLTESLVAGLTQTFTRPPEILTPTATEYSLAQVAAMPMEVRQNYYEEHEKIAVLGLLLNLVPALPMGYIYLDRWDSFWTFGLLQGAGLVSIGLFVWSWPLIALTAALVTAGLWVASWFDVYAEAERQNRSLAGQLRLSRSDEVQTVPLLAWQFNL